jgi:hypothetical protein
MPTDLPNDAPSGDRYAYKASLIGSAHEFELTDKGLAWTAAGRSGLWACAEISEIRLSYRPVSMQSRRFRADISHAGGGRIRILSTTWQTVSRCAAASLQIFMPQLSYCWDCSRSRWPG